MINTWGFKMNVFAAYATRSKFVEWTLDYLPDSASPPALGTIVEAGSYSYIYKGAVGGTTISVISDLPGWVPFGTPTALHFGADNTGSETASSSIPAVSAMLDYVNGLGGGLALMPAGKYIWDGELVKSHLNKVILQGDGNATRIERSGDFGPAIRFWGGANNRIRRILIDCVNFAGRGFYLEDQYSGIEDCECNNCPDRPFGMQGGGNDVYGLDSAGRNSDDSGFVATDDLFFPVGCYFENCRASHCGNTAFSQKQMPHSRIQRCVAQNIFSEGITADRCDYSVISSNTLLDVAKINTSEFSSPGAGGGGVGGIGIDGSTGVRVVKNTIIGVQTTTSTRNNRSRAAINFVNNLQAANGCQIEGNYISDAKVGIWLKGIVSGAAGNNYRHIITGNVYENMGTAAGTGFAQYGAVWIDTGCTDNIVTDSTQLNTDPLVTGDAGVNKNGRFIKFGNGWMICTREAFVMGRCTSADGSSFKSSSTTWTFPAAFSSAPFVSGMADDVDVQISAATPNPVSVAVRCHSATSKAVVLSGRLTAIGRWNVGGAVDPFTMAGVKFAYDLQDASTLWQDTSATVPVTQPNDPVGRISDKSGNGYHLLQSLADKRPLYQIDTDGHAYIQMDGVNDFLSAAGVNLSSSKSVTIFAAVRKDTDATQGTVLEHSTNFSTTVGSFRITAPNTNAIQNFGVGIRGLSGYTNIGLGTFVAPYTAIVTLLGSTDVPLTSGRVNGVEVDKSTSAIGSTNFGTQTLFMGMRAGTQLPFKGRIYAVLGYVGTLSTADIRSIEDWLNQRAGAY